MTDTILVIHVEEAKRAAYNDGFDRFEGMEETEGFDLTYFHDSATYANHVLPKLRRLSGFADSGVGTYTGEREVAVVEPEQADDRPIEADLVSSRHLMDEIREAWGRGVYDAVDGEERQPFEV